MQLLKYIITEHFLNHRISDDIAAFFGGFLSFFYPNTQSTLLFVSEQKIFNADMFHAFINGLIGLFAKLLFELIIRYFNRKKSKSKDE